MRFSRIILGNWRNFQHVDVSLQERAFLIGPNAVGKSNFLDVFRFLRDLVIPGGGFEKAVADRGGVSRIRSLAARRQPNVTVEVMLEENGGTWRYRIVFAQDKQRRPLLKEEKVWHDSELILSRPDNEDRTDPERQRQTHLEQTFANHRFREIAGFFATVHYYHLVPQLIREPERYTVPQRDPYGGDFLERIADTPQRTREARLRHIQKVLKIAAPQLRELKLERDEKGKPHIVGNYEHWRLHGAWQTEADFSDGTLRLMGLLWSLLEGSGPLLLEEPELSLHPEIVRYIPQMLQQVQRDRKQRRRQVFISTHSTALLQDEGIAADEILLFKPTQGGSEIRVGVAIEEVCQLLEAGLSPADVVMPYTTPPDAIQLKLWNK